MATHSEFTLDGGRRRRARPLSLKNPVPAILKLELWRGPTLCCFENAVFLDHAAKMSQHSKGNIEIPDTSVGPLDSRAGIVALPVLLTMLPRTAPSSR